MKSYIILLSALLLNSCITEGPLNQPFDSIEPVNLGDGIIISTPQAENIDSDKLESIYKEVYDDDNLWSLRSLLVFRNGKLVSESYLKDKNDITTQHLIWSCTKQVMGVLTGIAIDKGIIESIDDPISKYLADEINKHKDKGDITIRNLLTMQSGIDYSNDGLGGETDLLLRQIPDDMVEFVLGRPMSNEPGTKFNYKDGDPHLISAIIQKTTGKPTDVWADEVFFSKIGITNLNWIRYKDGITFGGFGIETTPRELAKIALCVADSGRWNNQQIVSKEWISEMLKISFETEFEYSFGYLWWMDISRNIYFMWGHGGQLAFIIPDKNLLVVFTSIPNTQDDSEIRAEEAMPVVDKIISICQ